MSVLVTGGSGYIGAHLVGLLRGRGEDVVVIDDGETGFRERIPGVDARTLDLAEAGAVAALRALMAEREVESVVHFAARKQVPESIAKPAWYYAQNVGGLIEQLGILQHGDAGTAEGIGHQPVPDPVVDPPPQQLAQERLDR